MKQFKAIIKSNMDTFNQFLKNADAIKAASVKAVDYAIVNGILMRTKAKPQSSEIVQHAPFTLFPSPVPKDLFKQAVDVQKDFNVLMHMLGQDHDFLAKSYDSVLQTDEFTRNLYNIYEATRKIRPKKTELGILRSDYMFHQGKPGCLSLKQIEVNMIAASFNGIGTEKMTSLHKHTLSQNGFDAIAESVLDNSAPTGIANGLIAAWNVYAKSSAIMVFVVTDTEQNIFDQRCLEFRINELNKNIRIRRFTLSNVADCGRLDERGCLFIGADEVAVVYYRAGYVPKEYPSKKEWDARAMMDRSTAINCPSAGHQLVGAKKMQQVLAQPGTVEKFIHDAAAVKRIRDTFAGFYGLEMGKEGDHAVDVVMKNKDDYVLKPQLEGGGNNLYGDEMVKRLKDIGQDERRCQYIIMEKIRPMPVKSVILSATAGSDQYLPVEGVSELGIYGVVLASGDNVIQNSFAGHLLRTKASHHEDGGVAAGVAVLDSLLLF